MFKKIKINTIKKVAATNVSNLSKTQIAGNIIGELKKSSNQIFLKVHSSTSDAIKNEEKFLSIVDSFYKKLPFQTKIILRKKRFQKILLKLRDKYLEKGDDFSDEMTSEIISNNMADED